MNNLAEVLEAPKLSSGENNDYYCLLIHSPKRFMSCKVECEDIIRHLDMSFDEGAAFKALWRRAAERQGNGKPNDSQLRNAQQVAHYGKGMVDFEKKSFK